MLTNKFYSSRMKQRRRSTAIERRQRMKLFDSELKIMEILWEKGDTTAKQLADFAKEKIGWGKTTTYTVITKCVQKKAIERREPGFVCHALIDQEQAQEYETNELIDKMYGGSAGLLVAALVQKSRLSQKEIQELKKMIENMK